MGWFKLQKLAFLQLWSLEAQSRCQQVGFFGDSLLCLQMAAPFLPFSQGGSFALDPQGEVSSSSCKDTSHVGL